jgi:carboxymethylenebutenolidase
MQTQTIELATPDGPMDVYEATPDNSSQRGAVVVIQEAFGVNDHIKDVARRFAGEGYHAVAPAIFHRAGGGTAPYEDFSKIMPLFEGLTDDGVLMDFDATLDYLHGAGFDDDNIGIVGFCFGGRVTFLVAARRAIGASVGFYGGGITHNSQGMAGPLASEAASLRTPWLGLFGDQDAMIPVDGVEDLRVDLAKASVDTEVVRYPDAGHGFHCDERDSFHEASATDGWQRALDWFSTHLQSPA